MTYIPFLLRRTFPVPLTRLRTLAYALTVGGLYAMAEDKLIDSEVDATLSHSLLVPSLYGEFIRTLHTLFPSASRFWSYHDRFFSEYQMAEITANRKMSRASLDKYRYIAKAKSAPVKLALCGMAILSGRSSDISKLLRSFDYWIIGCQLYDDVLDWRQDYFSLRQSLIVARIQNLLKSAGASRPRRLAEIQRIVHSSDIVESILEESGRWFTRAAKCVRGIKCDEWIRFLEGMAVRTRATIENVVTLKVNVLFGN